MAVAAAAPWAPSGGLCRWARRSARAQHRRSRSFLANLAAQCRTKKEEWDVRSKTRAEEIAGISEAIKILNVTAHLHLRVRRSNSPSCACF